ncbi:MAG: helix-turn-helix domain-containing protein [Chitinophagaceae bacterium]|jgi:transcriptional regulator with XRE-family HTH domain|nr:helix-turn-helix domain-containing protein [Chitinophagaceae bacterium]
MKPTETIGKNIKFFREKKGIKQEVLAKQIGITKSRLSQIESGDCGELFLNRIEKIAGLLEVSFFDLTGNSTQNVHINNSSNFGGFYGSTNYNFSPELIKALADELVNRIQK